ncbi:MAG: hypothetical protein GSR78_04520 [Desulfurococcales archaeon]|nr:hypothetical protein [Desulfurococcales archaeon]
MPGYASITLVILSLMAAMGTAIISYSMYRLLSIYKSVRLEYALAGFIFLTVAQILAAASYLADAARLAYALFVASTASSLSSYLLLYYSAQPPVGRSGGEAPLLFAGGLTIPVLLDLASALVAAGVAYRSRHKARYGFVLVSAAHFVRAVAVQAGAVEYLYLLLLGEIVRVAAVALLVVYYAGRVLGVASKV